MKRGGDGGECGAGVVGDDDEFAAAVAAVCAALGNLGDPNAPDLILVTVGDDANEEAQVRMIVEAHKLVESITWEREAERLGDALNEAACGTKMKEETKKKERTKKMEETKMKGPTTRSRG